MILLWKKVYIEHILHAFRVHLNGPTWVICMYICTIIIWSNLSLRRLLYSKQRQRHCVWLGWCACKKWPIALDPHRQISLSPHLLGCFNIKLPFLILTAKIFTFLISGQVWCIPFSSYIKYININLPPMLLLCGHSVCWDKHPLYNYLMLWVPLAVTCGTVQFVCVLFVFFWWLDGFGVNTTWVLDLNRHGSKNKKADKHKYLFWGMEMDGGMNERNNRQIRKYAGIYHHYDDC